MKRVTGFNIEEEYLKVLKGVVSNDERYNSVSMLVNKFIHDGLKRMKKI